MKTPSPFDSVISCLWGGSVKAEGLGDGVGSEKAIAKLRLTLPPAAQDHSYRVADEGRIEAKEGIQRPETGPCGDE